MELSEQLEVKRKARHAWFVRLGIMWIILVLCLWIGGLIGTLGQFLAIGGWMFCITLAIIILLLISIPFASKAEEKELFSDIIERQWEHSVEYVPEQGFKQDEIRSLEFFEYPEGSRYISTDYVSTALPTGNSIEIADVSISYTTGSGKNSQTHNVYDGVVFKAHYPLDFDGITWVSTTSPFIMGYKKNIGDTVRLESPEFTKLYTVRSTNQTGARMALQTDVMERLIHMARDKKIVELVFRGSDVWIFLTMSKNWLDLSFFSSLYNTARRTESTLLEISSICEDLKLHFLGNRVVKAK